MGGQGSGGANGGPQYNPANVSGTGGAGQSGNYTGFAYGQNQEVNNQRVEGNQAMASAQAATPSAPQEPYQGINMPQLGTLLDPTTRPDEPITAGVDFGPGPGREALPKNLINNTRIDENAKIAAQYLPDLAFAAKSPDAPDSFKRFVNYLIENAQGINPNG
ncbi:MAG: hypothetical protein EBR60_05905 [Burkholderiaceae bacterium]|nr:hypothetical protein [Burkholderiaceae bacterium]